MEIQNTLKQFYDSQYDESIVEWRELGAIQKANNIIELSKNIKFDNVLDVGAGEGSILRILSDKKLSDTFTALEISDSGIEKIKEKKIKGLVNLIKFDGYHIPLEDNSIDLAICSHVIEHVEFPRLLLREIKRVSKKQIFEIPIDFSFNVDKKFKVFNAYGHINIYTPALFNFLLLTENYVIEHNKYNMYEHRLIKYMSKGKSLQYFLHLIRYGIWFLIPFLKKVKPHSYLVQTSSM